MLELTGNLWDFHKQGHYICITTNGTLRSDGACVMGRGIALQAKRRYPKLPYELGDLIHKGGNTVHFFPAYRLFSLPVKHNFWEEADLSLIKESCQTLKRLFNKPEDPEDFESALFNHIYLPRPGCGNGGLSWSTVKPIIAPILNDRFTVVEIQLA